MLGIEDSLCLLDLFVEASYFRTSFPYLLIICLCMIIFGTENDFSVFVVLRYKSRKNLWRRQTCRALLLSGIITVAEVIVLLGYAASCKLTKYNWDIVGSYFFLNMQRTLHINWHSCLLAYVFSVFLFSFGSMVFYIINRWIFNIPVASWFSLIILFYFEYYSKYTFFYQNLYLKYEDWIECFVWNKLLTALLIIIGLLGIGEWFSYKKEFYVG